MPPKKQSARRPPSEDLTATIANLVASGNALATAAAYAEMPWGEVEYWMGQEGSDFQRAIAKAEAEAEARDVRAIGVAADGGDWHAAEARAKMRRQRQEDEELRRINRVARG